MVKKIFLLLLQQPEEVKEDDVAVHIYIYCMGGT